MRPDEISRTVGMRLSEDEDYDRLGGLIGDRPAFRLTETARARARAGGAPMSTFCATLSAFLLIANALFVGRGVGSRLRS